MRFWIFPFLKFFSIKPILSPNKITKFPFQKYDHSSFGVSYYYSFFYFGILFYAGKLFLDVLDLIEPLLDLDLLYELFAFLFYILELS